MYILALAFLTTAAEPPGSPKAVSPKDALQPFNVLVGSWKGSGAPEGTKDERAAGAWTETIEWAWKYVLPVIVCVSTAPPKLRVAASSPSGDDL